MDWITGMQKSLDYIEEHLTEPINYDTVAEQSFSSSYHFQRAFSFLCGYTISEYIRNRRLTLAGVDLAAGNAKVIDVALKYGYESPDSFAKAFQKFHGILPSQAKNQGIRLKSFSRLVLKLSLEGGTIMNYRIETKPELKLIGYKKHFDGTPYDSQREKQEEDFFVTTRASQWMLKGITNDKLSDYCVLSDMDDNGYDFYFAVTAHPYELENLYNSEVTGIDFMDRFHFETLVIPKSTFAVFETEKQKMPIPEYVELRKQIAAELLGNNEYQMLNAHELAVYHWGITGGYTERSIEIWIPVEKR